jgi:uncharacterized membrane protein YuzA (DUF378 family)
MQLFEALWNVILAVVGLAAALATTIAPWWPLIAWIAFWLLAVNWRRLYPVISSGGFIGLLLLWFTMILVWGVVSPPEGGTHHILGLHVSNFFGKMIYVTGLYVITALCGVTQLSGACDRCLRFEEDGPSAEPAH